MGWELGGKGDGKSIKRGKERAVGGSRVGRGIPRVVRNERNRNKSQSTAYYFCKRNSE